MHIYHIADINQWKQAEKEGLYRHPTLATEGFIHCSTSVQLEQTANRYFRDHKLILVLTIDVGILKAPLKFEAAPSGEIFPHIYGPVNTSAVVNTKQIEREGDTQYKIEF